MTAAVGMSVSWRQRASGECQLLGNCCSASGVLILDCPKASMPAFADCLWLGLAWSAGGIRVTWTPAIVPLQSKTELVIWMPAEGHAHLPSWDCNASDPVLQAPTSSISSQLAAGRCFTPQEMSQFQLAQSWVLLYSTRTTPTIRCWLQQAANEGRILQQQGSWHA